VINNFLDTAKSDIGELEINNIETDMKDILSKTWGICSQIIVNKNLIGMIKISKKVPSILSIDPYRLMQILINLVGNAAKFTK
jgi:signal transduction histidine kinase